MIKDLTVNQLVEEKNVRSATKQTELFGFNRYVYVFFSVLILIMVGRALIGWPEMAEMLYDSGAYEWLCTDQERSLYLIKKNDKNIIFGRFACNNQEIVVNSLYSTVYTSLMVSSGIAGAFMHFFGSRFTFIFGAFAMMSGWCILGISSINFKGYEAGIVLVSLGMDPIVFSLLSSVNAFPGREVLITGIYAASASLGMMIPGLLRVSTYRTGLTAQNIFLIFGFSVHSLMILFALFCIPPKRFYKQHEIDEEIKRIGENRDIELGVNIGRELNSPSISEVESPSKMLNSATIQPQEDLIIKDNKTRFVEFINCKGRLTRVPWPLTIAIVLHFMFTIAQGAHIMNVLMVSYGGVPAQLLSIGLPLSFIPCLILGIIADKYSVTYVLWYEVIGIIVSLSLIVFLLYPLGNAAAVVYSLTNACITGQFWFLIVDLYEPNIQTFVLGTMSLVSGLGSMFERVLFPSVAHSVPMLKSTIYGYMCIGAIQAILVYIISVYRKRIISMSTNTVYN